MPESTTLEVLPHSFASFRFGLDSVISCAVAESSTSRTIDQSAPMRD
jgi:hypothetical protein